MNNKIVYHVHQASRTISELPQIPHPNKNNYTSLSEYKKDLQSYRNHIDSMMTVTMGEGTVWESRLYAEHEVMFKSKLVNVTTEGIATVIKHEWIRYAYPVKTTKQKKEIFEFDYKLKFLLGLTNKVNELDYGSCLSVEEVEAVLIAIGYSHHLNKRK